MQNVRGMQDVHGNEWKNFEYIIKKADEISKYYGFNFLSTPILEFSSLFERNLGEESDVVKKEIYKFTDRGGEELALRPEFTASVVRSFIQNNFGSGRFFSYGPLFRYDRPQKGRFRQFNQVNFESFGKSDSFEDAEIIILAYKFLTSILQKECFTLELSSLGSKETLNNYKIALIEFFTKNKEKLSNLSKERLIKNPIRILDSKESEDVTLCDNAPTISNFYTQEEQKYFNNLQQFLINNGISFIINPKIVRGLDYYTGVVFEFTTTMLGSQSAILAGGRYDNLVKEMGGKETSAIGFAAGIERLSLLLKKNFEPLKCLFILPVNEGFNLEALKLAEKFREQKIIVKILTSSSVTKRLERASKESYTNYALVLGENEIKSNLFKVKNLTESKEETGDFNFILQYLK